MKNKKFMKALLALGLGVVSAFSAVGFAACGGGNGGNGGGNGDGEGEGGGGTTPTQLAAPVISRKNKKITWSAVEHATGYKVYEKASAATTASEKGTVTTCEYTIAPAAVDTYEYYVVATSTSENYTDSQKSNTVSYEVFDMSTVNVPAPKVPEHTGNGAALVAGTENVKYTFLGGDLAIGTLEEEWSNGTFSVPVGSKIRSRNKSGVYIGSEKFSDDSYTNSIHMGDDTSALVLDAPAAGTLYIHVQNGSGSASMQSLNFTKPDGTTTQIQYEGTVSSNKIQRLTIPIEEAGTYTIKRTSGTSDLLYAEFNATLNNSPIESIEVVNKGKSDYLLTQQLDVTGIKVSAKHAETGKISEVNLSNVVFDTSAYNAKVSGTYTIGVSYTVEGNLTSDTKTFTTSYEVNVYAVSSIKLGTTLTTNEKQTTLKQAYLPNEPLDTTGLTVTATGTLGNASTEFKMNAADYTIVSPGLATEGKKPVKVSVARAYANGDEIEESYDIIVKAKKDPVSNEVVVTVGGQQGEFETVTQALAYLKACNYEEGVVKTINIADGEYKEKIHIDLPNVHLMGSATNTPDATTDNGVVLWYDAANGTADPSGAAYGTKGSASVTVTTNATGFVAENITFKNYYNTADLYYALKAETSGTQAVALLVESPNAIFRNCKMTGYQDTLYANKGYHFYDHCWIEGRTDYIFGADAIPYFYQCTIYTVSAGAKDGDGGYIVAYQNKDVANGPVFNDCEITGATEGATNIALGRAWGANCKMVTMNSRISGNYSTAAHTATTVKGQRYVTMSGNEPKAANMLEYNNTGDGAITATIPNTCTVMDATAAAPYQIENVAILLKFNPIKEDTQA